MRETLCWETLEIGSKDIMGGKAEVRPCPKLWFASGHVHLLLAGHDGGVFWLTILHSVWIESDIYMMLASDMLWNSITFLFCSGLTCMAFIY